MNLYKSTAAVLRYGVIISILIIAVGIVSDLVQYEYYERIMWAGILALILTPLLGIIVSLAALVSEKDWKWVYVTLVLIAVVSVGMVISVFL